MHPRLIKLSILKHTLAPRDRVMRYLDTLDRLDALPASRCATDAGRAAASYLHKYRQHVSVMCYDDYSRETFGREHLFDNDLRRLATALLADEVETLWPGIWVCLTHAPTLKHVSELGQYVTAGSLTVDTLLLANSKHNAQTLATQLSAHYIGALEGLKSRLTSPRPNVTGIEAEYRTLCLRIRRAEEALGVPMQGTYEQAELEKVLTTTHPNGRNNP